MEASGYRDILEGADFDCTQRESGLRHQPDFHAAIGADKEYFGAIAINKFPGHGQRRNDMATGSTTGDQNAQFRQYCLKKRPAELGKISWFC
jgi:hypothetical protein